MSRVRQTNPFSDPLVEKNRVRHGKNVNFTRVVVTLALLGHQTSHSQNKNKKIKIFLVEICTHDKGQTNRKIKTFRFLYRFLELRPKLFIIVGKSWEELEYFFNHVIQMIKTLKEYE